MFTKKRRSPAFSLMLLSLIVLFSALSFQLSVRLEVISESYLLEALRKQRLELDTEYRRLQLVYAYLNRPDQIAKLATERLNLTQVRPEQIRVIRPKELKS